MLPVNLPQGITFDMGDRRWAKSSWRVFEYKTADQSVTSSTTLIDDTHLLFTIRDGEIWEARYVLYPSNLTTPGFTVRVAAASALGFQRFECASLAGTSDLNNSISGTPPSSDDGIEVSALIVGGADETVNLKWTQFSSSATPTTFKKYSYLIADRLA